MLDIQHVKYNEVFLAEIFVEHSKVSKEGQSKSEEAKVSSIWHGAGQRYANMGVHTCWTFPPDCGSLCSLKGKQ